jgi:hypothetical protein
MLRNVIHIPQATGKFNVVVEWLTLLPRIREILGSYLGPETEYPD